jgi:AcrR family transcriptional regulator
VTDVKGGDRPLSRRDRAEQTRARILEAAYRLFRDHGYEATTMQAVADAAGVAVQTVYFSFRTKGGLLSAIEDRAIPGGDQGPDWREQFERELRAERDPRALIARWVAETATVLNRITAFVAMIGTALQTDPESVAQRNRGRDGWFALLVERLRALDALKAELTYARALDVAQALVRVEGYQDLTQSFGWSQEEWVNWMTVVLTRELLD